MKCIIDRFEGEFAVVELPDLSHADLPRALVPDAEQGDLIDIQILKDETEQRREQLERRRKRLFRSKE